MAVSGGLQLAMTSNTLDLRNLRNVWNGYNKLLNSCFVSHSDEDIRRVSRISFYICSLQILLCLFLFSVGTF